MLINFLDMNFKHVFKHLNCWNLNSQPLLKNYKVGSLNQGAFENELINETKIN